MNMDMELNMEIVKNTIKAFFFFTGQDSRVKKTPLIIYLKTDGRGAYFSFDWNQMRALKL